MKKIKMKERQTGWRGRERLYERGKGKNGIQMSNIQIRFWKERKNKMKLNISITDSFVEKLYKLESES